MKEEQYATIRSPQSMKYLICDPLEKKFAKPCSGSKTCNQHQTVLLLTVHTKI